LFKRKDTLDGSKISLNESIKEQSRRSISKYIPITEKLEKEEKGLSSVQ